MIKKQPRPVLSEENEYNNQFYVWLNDSHYWIESEQMDRAFCKWCGQMQLQSLNSSRLCMKNPEILRVLSEIDNPLKKNNYDT